MYTSHDYQSKKALKADVEERNTLAALPQPLDPQVQIRFNRLSNRLDAYQPNGDITGFACPRDGRIVLEGPHYPQPHRWYAQAVVQNGVVIKVK